MRTNDVKIGMVVEVPNSDVEWIVQDKHPCHGAFWIHHWGHDGLEFDWAMTRDMRLVRTKFFKIDEPEQLALAF